MNEKKTVASSGIMKWLREILSKNTEELSTLKQPPEETVEKLIAKATGNKENEEAVNSNAINDDNITKEANPETEVKEESCPYALKRNIVSSLREIQKFAEENQLASTMVKALLTLLAEMAINALKGKVSGTVLALLLNAMNFDKARNQAYKEGELAGRNAKITEEYFPKTNDGIPNLPNSNGKDDDESIFSIARQA